MTGKPKELWGLPNYFCKCGFNCRTKPVWDRHKKNCLIYKKLKGEL